MSNPVFWILQCKINDDQLENLKELMVEMVNATQADEPGALIYEWYISADEKYCHFYECYADSAAALVHLGNFNTKFGKQFWTCLSPTSTIVYGDPSKVLRKAMENAGARFMEPLGGFKR